MKKLIVIADWSMDGLYTQSFRSIVEGFLMDQEYPQISFVRVDSNAFSTGFLLKQLVQTEEMFGRPQNTIFYVSSPGKPTGPFMILRLASGMMVCGFNTDTVFSFLKRQLKKIDTYTEQQDVFSIDRYPRLIAHLMNDMEDEMEFDELPTNIIPEVRGAQIGYIDYAGSIVLTITEDDLKGKSSSGSTVEVRIGEVSTRIFFDLTNPKDHTDDMVLTTSRFGPVDAKYLMITPTFSGIHSGLTPAHFFKNPAPGTVVDIK
jgi:hypothetical protein